MLSSYHSCSNVTRGHCSATMCSNSDPRSCRLPTPVGKTRQTARHGVRRCSLTLEREEHLKTMQYKTPSLEYLLIRSMSEIYNHGSSPQFLPEKRPLDLVWIRKCLLSWGLCRGDFLGKLCSRDMLRVYVDEICWGIVLIYYAAGLSWGLYWVIMLRVSSSEGLCCELCQGIILRIMLMIMLRAYAED
jgi:hypothetical protein